MLPYTRAEIADLAKQVIRAQTTLTGVQAKLSLDINPGGRNEPARFTIVGLWGRFILKPQTEVYRSLPELEDLTMHMAEAAKIAVVPHSLIRFADGELCYITRRIDREDDGRKIAMEDMCQLSERLTEYKYKGSYEQVAKLIKKYSAMPQLDLVNFWEVVVFSWITGNADMHLKNFSLYHTALGHIHGPQKVGRETVRYCGTPLKYSLSEANHTKSVTVVDIPENKKIEIRTVPLVPMHELREVKGTFDELMDRRNYEGTAVDDYLYVVLTDEDDVPDALGKLRTVYPNVMKLGYDNTRTRVTQTIDDGAVLEGKKPIDLFGELYEKQNNKEMSDEQRSFVQDIIDSIWKEERL